MVVGANHEAENSNEYLDGRVMPHGHDRYHVESTVI